MGSRGRSSRSSVYVVGPIFSSDDYPMTHFKLGSHLTSLLACALVVGVLVFAKSTIRLSRKTQGIFLMAAVVQMLARLPWKLLDFELIQLTLFCFVHFTLIALASAHQKYGKHDDSFKWKPLVIATVMLALISNGNIDFQRISLGQWSLSNFLHSWGLYLEAVAILPQLVWLSVSRVKSNMNTKILHAYVYIQTVAKILSVVHWAYVYQDRKKYDHVAVKCDLFQLTSHVLFLSFMILRKQGVAKSWRNTGDTLRIK